MILILTTSYMLRERRYEIGIRYALGATKGKIIQMFLYESVLFMLMVSIISMGTGAVLATLFAQNSGGIRELNMHYYPTPGFVMALTAISLGVSLAASIVSAMYISKSSPSDLISKRSR